MLSVVVQFLCYSAGMQTWHKILKYSIILNGQSSWNTDLLPQSFPLPGQQLEEIPFSEQNPLNVIIRNAREKHVRTLQLQNQNPHFFYRG